MQVKESNLSFSYELYLFMRRVCGLVFPLLNYSCACAICNTTTQSINRSINEQVWNLMMNSLSSAIFWGSSVYLSLKGNSSDCSVILVGKENKNLQIAVMMRQLIWDFIA